MARPDQRLLANVPGDFFVDASCIACDTCRRVDSVTFGGGEDDTSFVARQPATGGERRRALMALVACPVSAIGTLSRHGAEAAAAASAFPEPLAPGDDVHACGYAAESSFGAASWLLVRPGGNVLVDSPRFAGPLLARLRALGGARWMFLTHRDDVSDHARWAEALGCERVIHARDVTAGTREVERRLEGDEPIALDEDLLAIPVPGHTPGSTALLHARRQGTSPRPTEVAAGDLFSGDHLWGDAAGRLGASRSVCWWDWSAQTRSMERLLEVPFQRVLPGHGRPWRARSPEAARAALAGLVAAMRRA